ncbi:MAG: Hsp70 family protein [Thermoanaerobaculia bacterium]|nr:Hsp70 family protein [Thermoanaerobaculia bacterium]
MASRDIFMGIDLGTTNSTAAVFDGERVDFVRDQQGATVLPSVVRIDSRGTVTAGSRARRYLESDPENTRTEFKRLMGTREEMLFPASRQKKTPPELAAEVLKVIRRAAGVQIGFEPEQAVISVPALFELPQSAATSEAGRLAGFSKVELIQEPVASALAAGWTADEDEGFWLVYDLGGGTFDASLLETRDGLLRVVAHDGDNFLGGRDIDQALSGWLAERLAEEHGVRVSRSDPSAAALFRRLKLAAEEAKIELSHASEAVLSLEGISSPKGEIDVDLVLNRATLDALALPVIEKSIEVCERLVLANGVEKGKLHRVVLVGGPTAMPVLRQRIRERLQIPVAEGLDPMTLVAHGAALFALTSRLPARPVAVSEEKRRSFWLQYPGMSSDPAPHVLGRLTAAPGDGTEPSAAEPFAIRLSRSDGGWKGGLLELDAEGAFVTSVELLPRKTSVFFLEAFAKDGSVVPVEPRSLTIVHGLTISDPPLSRTVGVALADDSTREFIRRGTPLPARKTLTLRTVETVAKGSEGSLLKIPIIQGEFPSAHLCRLVGTLEIAGREVTATLPPGSAVEVTLELDRGGRLSARAFVPALNRVFSEVAHLAVPEIAPDSLAAAIASARERLAGIRRDAFANRDRNLLERAGEVEAHLAEAARDLAAARGGEPDSTQRAQRNLLDAEAVLAELEEERSWPELWDEAQQEFAFSAEWVARLGTEIEERHLSEAGRALEKAHQGKNATELSRQLRLVKRLGTAAFYRHPDAWFWMFDAASSSVSRASEPAKAAKLVKEGEEARKRGDSAAVRGVVERLWALLPPDPEFRRLGYDSGIR